MEAGEKSEDTAPTRDETENPKLSDLVKETIDTDTKSNNDEKSNGYVPNRNLMIDVETEGIPENSKKVDGVSGDDQQSDESIQPQVASIKATKQEQCESKENNEPERDDPKEQPCVKMAQEKPEGKESESTRKDEGMSIVDRIKNKVLFSTFSHLLIICPFFNFLLSYFFVQYIRQQITSLSCCFELSRSFPSILISINNMCLLDI